MNRIGKLCGLLDKSGAAVKFVYIVLSAFVFALPYMVKELWICGWFGLSLMFVAVFDFRKPLKRVFGSLFCFFFVFFVFAYSWFVSLFPLDFAGLSSLESVGVIIIAETVIPLLHSTLMTLGTLLGYVAARLVSNGYIKASLISFGYIIGEFFQSLGTLAFPWTPLFVGQASRLEILQSASLFGQGFVSFIILFVNALLALSVRSNEGNDEKSKAKVKRYLCAALAVFVLNFGFGAVRLGIPDSDKGVKITAAALQGNIPSGEKWQGSSTPATEIYLDLAHELYSHCLENGINIDVAVLPETAFASTINPESRDGISYRTSSDISKLLSCNLFVGAFKIEGDEQYNSIFLFDENGNTSSNTYNKVNLVPFGEFLPYRNIISRLAPSLAEINMLSSDLSKGKAEKPLDTLFGDAACLVCFDSIFSENARIQAKNGADFIVVSTNDSWYKRSNALYQHMAHSVMRAIENNVPVIRSANTGISIICDGKGRILAKSDVEKREYIVADVVCHSRTTLYTKVGNVMIVLGFVFIFGVIIVWFEKKKILPR